ncbi:chitosanase [Streptomyces roseoverticillatus]|uniref:chitosanase n=1 Tax=Streptomyces roseoverticillatus TaxID=66429 RepID=UPI001F35D8DE|nr:chitosanase [Streptomyces roseoverticillatus]MCF3106928.1 chitosanase [Streptomyces roseoverticillatus]
MHMRIAVAGSVLALVVAPAVTGFGPAASARPPVRPATARGLDSPRAKEVAMELVASAENSTLDWRSQYGYLEDIRDGQGYTGGIIGFCSGTGDMLEVVVRYTHRKRRNPLAPYLPALRRVNGTASHAGLGTHFERAWKTAARDEAFQAAQEEERDRVYFGPAVRLAEADGLRTLGQFIYFDAVVMHGNGHDKDSLGAIRRNAMRKARVPARGGDEKAYLNAFLDARKVAIKNETVHGDTTRVDTEQRVFLDEGNFGLRPPLRWRTYGNVYEINHWPHVDGRRPRPSADR